jgi:integrase/recombinase XerD
MLENYYIKPGSIDRIHNSWLGQSIERYVRWLSEQGYSSISVLKRVPILMQFGEFSRNNGAKTLDEISNFIDDFAANWVREHGKNCKTNQARKGVSNEAKKPIHQMLELVLPDYAGGGRTPYIKLPFLDFAPDFFNYLNDVRGLRQSSIQRYGMHLRAFEEYISKIAIHTLKEVSPTIVSSFITNSGRELEKSALTVLCCTLRVFFNYLYRERLICKNIGSSIELPRKYRLSNVPRSILWSEVQKMLEVVDQHTTLGKRDYAILLLLVTYGLRAHEVAKLTLDHIDWKRDLFRIPDRKAGHSTSYPLTPIVGKAILNYIQARPKTSDRHLFLRVAAPLRRLTNNSISCRASYYLHKAGIAVSLPGSHTLRHTCVQRLVDADFSLKTIGDYVGHKSPSSTNIYTKIAVESLREVALGDVEDLL